MVFLLDCVVGFECDVGEDCVVVDCCYCVRVCFCFGVGCYFEEVSFWIYCLELFVVVDVELCDVVVDCLYFLVLGC